MTVTYLPATQSIHDEATRQNFEYLENFGLFLDQQGKGIVLQLLSAQQLQLALGSINCPPGATVINHGIGRIPIAISLTPFFAAAALTSPLRVSANAAASFTVTNDNTTTTTVFWLAVG